MIAVIITADPEISMTSAIVFAVRPERVNGESSGNSFIAVDFQSLIIRGDFDQDFVGIAPRVAVKSRTLISIVFGRIKLLLRIKKSVFPFVDTDFFQPLVFGGGQFGDESIVKRIGFIGIDLIRIIRILIGGIFIDPGILYLSILLLVDFFIQLSLYEIILPYTCITCFVSIYVYFS